jgi:transposase
MESRRYPTDLSDDEWRCIGPHLHGPAGRGRPRLHGLRAILDAVFYVLKNGCPWRLLPKDFPPWKTVYDWFRRWRIDGTWEHLNSGLRECASACGRRSEGTRTPAPGSQKWGFVHSRGYRCRRVITTSCVAAEMRNLISRKWIPLYSDWRSRRLLASSRLIPQPDVRAVR